MKHILTAAAFVLSAEAAACETVTSNETFEDRSGYPCFATLHTDVGKSITLQLSDYKDVWSLKFFISDRATVYRQFFNTIGLPDQDAFYDTLGSVSIGERTFEFAKTRLYETRRQDVDEDSAGIFTINEQHNVARAIEAMTGDGI